MVGNQSVFLHFGKLAAHRATIHAEVIGELLAVIRNYKCFASRVLCTLRKVRHQPPADRFGTGMQDLLGKL